MIRVGWKSLAAILVWGTLIPVWAFWVVSGWRRARENRVERSRFVRCRLCGADFSPADSGEACPQCGAKFFDGKRGGDSDKIGGVQMPV
jgi:DNA-directed RNA polymerase subunit RPC12/RpoP